MAVMAVREMNPRPPVRFRRRHHAIANESQGLAPDGSLATERLRGPVASAARVLLRDFIGRA